MLKFNQNVDIKGSTLLLSFASVGLTGNFASSILINNHDFVNIGFLFSHYLTAYAGVNPETGVINYNGQAYFNSSKKIVLINFFTGVSSHFRKQFSEELLQLYQNYSFTNIILYGGISKSYLNDEELRNTNLTVYHLTNDNETDDKKFNMKNFEKLVSLENKKKPLEELKFIERCGPAKHLVKFFAKNNTKFSYLFCFSSELFDPLAGIAVYYKLALILGFRNDDIVIPKNTKDPLTILDNFSNQFKVEPTWRLFLKE